MSDVIHIDFETFSEVDIRKAGTFKYAENCEILILAIAKNDQPVLTWDVGEKCDSAAIEMLREAIESGALIYAHNATFEMAVCKYQLLRTFGIDPPHINQWRCTAAMCRLAAIPSSLAKAGEFLKIGDASKDKAGSSLIQVFSVPKRIKTLSKGKGKAEEKIRKARVCPTKHTDWNVVVAGEKRLVRDAFAMFVDYCRQDVVAEREIHKRLHRFEMSSRWNLESFQQDLRMNDLGIPINHAALLKTQAGIDAHQIYIADEFKHLTGVLPTQRAKVMEWLAEQGYGGADMTRETVAEWLGSPSMTAPAQAALHLYSQVQSAAIKKVKAMLEMVCSDGRIRGALMWAGAERTHRWTGKGIQPQNFARPTVKATHSAYQALCAGAEIQEIEAVYGDFYSVVLSCIRHFIQPPTGLVLQADYSSIEARVAPWLCGEEATLDLFRRGEKLYERMAGLIFSKPIHEVTNTERFVGKQAILGCSYSLGPAKFRMMCENYGFSPPDSMVEAYKPKHDRFIENAIETTKGRVAREYADLGKEVPFDFDYTARTIVDKKWDKLECDIMNPQTQEEWRHFAFDELANRAVRTWRAENPIVVKTWWALDDACKDAIRSPGKVIEVGKVRIGLQDMGLGEDALRIRLPSGHSLIYPKAKLVKDERPGWSGEQVMFWGVIPNKGGKWGWISTYGASTLESVTQATAGDIMREGTLAATAAGYDPFMLIHDEALCEQKPGQTHQELENLLCAMPDWAEGLPLAAEGATIQYYQKG